MSGAYFAGLNGAYPVATYLAQLAALEANRAALWRQTTGNWEVWYDGADTPDKGVPEAYVWDTPYDDDWMDARVRQTSFAPNHPQSGTLLVDRESDSRDWGKAGYLQRRDDAITKAYGLTLEFRAYIYPDAGAGGSHPELAFSAYDVMEDGTISGLFLSPGFIAAGSYNHIKASAECPTTNGFHTYRLMQWPGSNHFSVFVDGSQILESDGDADSALGSVTSQDSSIISIGGEGVYRAHYQLDYVRYSRGAYPADITPVPLPRSPIPLPQRLPAGVTENWTGTFNGEQTPQALGWTATVPSAWITHADGTVEFNSVQFPDGVGPWASLSHVVGLTNKGDITVELNAKVLRDSGEHGFTLHVRDEMGAFYFTLSPGKIETEMGPKGGAGRQAFFMNTTDDFHLYHLVREAHALYWDVYVDNNPIPAIYDQHVSADAFPFTFLQMGALQFADYNSFGTLHGHVAIDFVRWCPTAYGPPVPPALMAWKPIAAGDFNKDGNTDVLWKNSGGVVAEWFMGGGKLQGTAPVQTVDGWNAIASGDFNGDGSGDILWQNADGLVAEWLMANGAREGTASVHSMAGWTLLAAGDFNHDGVTDVIWDHGGGVLGGWLMGANGQIAGTVALPFFPGWSVIATGDYNHDGSTDILWKNADGLLAEWLMGNGTRQGTVTLANMAGWSAIASGDFNGDGTDDVMWRNADGITAVWFMNNGQVSQTRNFGSTAAESVVTAGDFNHDGVSEVMWQDATTGNISIWQFDRAGMLI